MKMVVYLKYFQSHSVCMVSSPYQSSKLERSPWKLVRHQSAKEKRRDQIVPSFSTAASFLLQVEDARR